MTPFSYANLPPPEYVCSACGLTGVRLFRQYQTFADCISLLCTKCAIKDQGEDSISHIPHNIGWLVAAVPTENGDTYWGYTSVPNAGVRWWDNLPVWLPKEGEKAGDAS